MSYKVTEETFDHLWPEWESLLTQSTFQTTFLTPSWQYDWWQEYGETATLYLRSIRDQGHLIGIAPLMSIDNTILFLGDTDLWDYHDFIIQNGREENFYPSMFEDLSSHPWDTLDFRSIPEFSPTMIYLPKLANQYGYTVDITQEDVSPGMNLPKTWDDYLLSLSKKNRHELRRKFRKLDAQVVHKSYSVDTGPINDVLDDFFNLMRISHEGKTLFLTQERERFFRRMAKTMNDIESLKLFFMEVSGIRIATAMCFDYGNSRFLYNSGYDPSYSALSVGLLLKALSIKDAIESEKTYYDFLRGVEPYKYHFGAKDVQLYNLVVHR